MNLLHLFVYNSYIHFISFKFELILAEIHSLIVFHHVPMSGKILSLLNSWKQIFTIIKYLSVVILIF